MSDIRLSKDMIGNKVRCVNKIDIYHPEQENIGTIVAYDEHDAIYNYKVQWPKGSTVGNDRWWAMNKCIELVKDDVTTSQKTTDMTNEEIWEMLRPKMEKNALTTQNIHTGSFWPIYTYNANDVHNAIAIAYRSGYERAIKGRPFKFNEKKKKEPMEYQSLAFKDEEGKWHLAPQPNLLENPFFTKKKNGHWVPVNPKKLPKEGAKIRYSRECKGYNNVDIEVGDTGVVEIYNSNWFGIKLDSPRSWMNWVCFDGIEDCLDVWVEDDE